MTTTLSKNLVFRQLKNVFKLVLIFNNPLNAGIYSS